MNQKLFAVRDIKAESFGAVMVCPTDGIARRTFADACADPRAPMAQYPEDFQLFELGVYDVSAGRIEGYALPKLVASATEYVKKPVVVSPEKATEVGLNA